MVTAYVLRFDIPHSTVDPSHKTDSVYETANKTYRTKFFRCMDMRKARMKAHISNTYWLSKHRQSSVFREQRRYGFMDLARNNRSLLPSAPRP